MNRKPAAVEGERGFGGNDRQIAVGVFHDAGSGPLICPSNWGLRRGQFVKPVPGGLSNG
jgi:hypothetical protein